VQQRSLNERVEYTHLIKSRTLFTDDVLTAAIGIGQFIGKGNTIKQKCLDWIAKYTADGATALFVAHAAKNVSGYIYKMVDRYLKEMKKNLPRKRRISQTHKKKYRRIQDAKRKRKSDTRNHYDRS
jgi:hypothetical protein